eukprot:1493177-Amphidinium_carterae.1
MQHDPRLAALAALAHEATNQSRGMLRAPVKYRLKVSEGLRLGFLLDLVCKRWRRLQKRTPAEAAEPAFARL